MVKLDAQKLKYAFITINILLSLIFLVNIILLVWRDEDRAVQVPLIVQIAGLVISILSCVTAVREYVWLLFTNCVLLLLLGVLTAARIFDELPNRKNARDVVNKAWADDAMEAIEREHNCCGVISAQDYIVLDKQLPDHCLQNNLLPGCHAELQHFYDVGHRNFIIASCLTTALILAAIVLGLMLAIKIHNNRRRMQF